MSFLDLQRHLAQHLRNPQHCTAPPHLDERGLHVYRYAVYANTARFLEDNFPRVKTALDSDVWEAMVRDYLANHKATTSMFVQLPLEFLTYLEDERECESDPAYLYELAHFDWLETLIASDERRIEHAHIASNGDPFDGIPILNPVHQMVCYHFPVHKIDAQYRPQAPPDTPSWLLGFRDRDLAFKFLDFDAATARLFELVRDHPQNTGRESLALLAAELGVEISSQLIHSAGNFLTQMQEVGLLISIRSR